MFACSCFFLANMCHSFSGQVTHRGDPFSASPDPRPQPLCLLRMCPLCLVPYPIILCPGSKNPCSPIVLLTCSTLPIVRNTPRCLPSSLANFHYSPPRHVYLWFAPLPPLLAFSPYIQPHYFSQSTSKIPPENLALPSHFYISCELHHIINLSYSQFFNLHLSSSLPLMG